MHTGTHIDAPLHMNVNGETFESLSLDSLVGPCQVLDLTAVKNGISKTDLEGFKLQKGDFILLKTKTRLRKSLILILSIWQKMEQAILLS